MNFRTKFKYLILCALFAFSTHASLTYAVDQVVIQAHTDCTGRASVRCGWGDIGEGVGGGGGGRANGGGGGNNNNGGGAGGDRTTGKSETFNRPPGCLRESLFAAQVVSTIAATGSPVGDFLSIPITDPNFSDGQWFKYQTSQYNSNWSAQTNTTYRSKMVIHYMFNVATKQVFQVKFKTSYQYGCVGIKEG